MEWTSCGLCLGDSRIYWLAGRFTLDENAFVGSGVVLFGAVLERFFALYCGPNNFTRLTLRSKQQK